MSFRELSAPVALAIILGFVLGVFDRRTYWTCSKKELIEMNASVCCKKPMELKAVTSMYLGSKGHLYFQCKRCGKVIEV